MNNQRLSAHRQKFLAYRSCVMLEVIVLHKYNKYKREKVVEISHSKHFFFLISHYDPERDRQL